MSFLKQVQSGRRESPFKIVLYGESGVGKSTFAAEAPSPIFLDVEGSTDELDVMRLPEVRSFKEVLAAIDELTNEQHEFRTFVIDTLDWLEALIWSHVCEAEKVKSIEDIPYGKGFAAALTHWRALLARLDSLREKRRMHIVLLAHSHIRTFRNPAGEDYERYELKLNQKAAGLIKEWPSALLFARVVTLVHVDKNKRARGVGDGTRSVATAPRPAFDAKNRYGLPAEIGLSWGEFEAVEAAARARQPVDGASLIAEIEELMGLVSPQVKVQAEGFLKDTNNDPQKLAKLADWLRGKVG